MLFIMHYRTAAAIRENLSQSIIYYNKIKENEKAVYSINRINGNIGHIRSKRKRHLAKKQNGSGDEDCVHL